MVSGRLSTVLAGAGIGTGGGVLLTLLAGLSSPWLAAALIVGMVVVGVVFLVPEVGVLMSVFVVPIERLGRFGDDTSYQMFSLMRVVGLLAITSVALHMALRRLPTLYPLPLVLYSAFLVVAAISTFFAYNPMTAKAHLATLAGNLLFLMLIVNGVRDWRMVKAALYTWLSITILIALYQVYDWHFGKPVQVGEIGTISHRFSTTWNSGSEAQNIGFVRRAMGTTSNAAVYGVNLMMTLPFFIYLAKVASSSSQRAVAVGGLLLVLYNMLLTNTRAVVVFGVFTLFYCVLIGLVRLSLSRIVWVLLGCIGLLYLLPEAVWKRVLDPANYSAEHSYNISVRFHLWWAGFRSAIDHWLIGVGPGDREQIIRYLDVGIDDDTISTHNEFLQTFEDVGLFGGLLFYAFVGSVILYSVKLAARLRHEEGASERYWFLVASQVALVSTVLFGVQVDVFHFSIKGWWLVAALVIVMRFSVLPRREGTTPARRGAATATIAESER